MPMCDYNKTINQPGGSRGGQVPPRKTGPIPVAKDGQTGLIERQQVTIRDLLILETTGHIGMILGEAERDYVNADLGTSLARLLWVNQLSDGLAASLKHDAEQSALPRAYSYQTATLMRQMQLGLDYYGLTLNQVSLVSVDWLKNKIEEQLKAARETEEAYTAYHQADQDNKLTIVHIQNAQALITKSNADTVMQMKAIAEDMVETVAAIERLGAARDLLWTEMLHAGDDFKAAVAAQGTACDFSKVLKIAAVVASVVLAAVTVGTTAALVPAVVGATQLNDDDAGGAMDVPDDFANFKYRVTAVANTGKSLVEFGQAYDNLNKAMKTPDSPVAGLADIPSDEIKIIAKAKDIEAQVDTFSSLPQAKAYETLIRAFVTTCETRNNGIVAYNNAVTTWHALNSSLKVNAAQYAQLQTAGALADNPYISEAAVFMGRSLLNAKAAVVKTLYQLDRACRYISLQDTGFKVDQFGVEALEIDRNDRVNAYDDYLAAKGNAAGDIDRLSIELRPYITDASWNTFKATRTVTVAIHPADRKMSAYCNVLATEVSFELGSPTGKAKTLRAAITHEGRALIFDETGAAHTFTHAPVRATYFREGDHVTTRGNTAGDGFAGVSPYGPWTITVDELDEGNAAFMDSVTGLEITVWGKYRSRVVLPKPI